MEKYRKKIVIIGATSLIAEHCARLWALENPAEMVLLARNKAKLEAVASDLRVRAPDTAIVSIKANFFDPREIQSLADEICKTGQVDIVLIAHGSLPHQQECQDDLNKCRDALEINSISPVLFAEAFTKKMEKVNTGSLVIISSVAGDRGRKSNYVYGAAKGLITRYAQGLQHRLADTNVKVVLIKPGPTDTPMTAHLKQASIKLESADHVARDIVHAVAKSKLVIYSPKIWALIMMVVRHLPNFVFKRMDV